MLKNFTLGTQIRQSYQGSCSHENVIYLQVNLLHSQMDLYIASSLRQRYQFNHIYRVSIYNNLHHRYNNKTNFVTISKLAY